MSQDQAAEIEVPCPEERRGEVDGLSIPMWDARSRQSATRGGDHETAPGTRRANGRSPWEQRRSQWKPVVGRDCSERSSKSVRVVCVDARDTWPLWFHRYRCPA